MVRHRSVFLSGLKTRLDRDIAERERSDAAPPPRWSAAPARPEDDDWDLETGAPPAPPRADDGPDPAPPSFLDRDDRAPSMLQESGMAVSGEWGHPEPPTTPWSENGMPERLRDAIASVRRMSDGGPEPDGDDQPPEQPEQIASWPAPDEDPPVDPVAARRPGLRVTGFALASTVVLLVGFGVGALLAGWDLGLVARLPTPTASPSVGPVAKEEPPATPVQPQAPPPIEEIVRLQPPPLPPAAASESPPATSGLPLPPPPKPAPWSNVANGVPDAADEMDRLIDAAVSALVEEGGGSPAASAMTSATPARVYVHFAASAAGGPAIAQHLVRRLEAEGFAAEARAVDFPIDSPSIRYFFAADRDSAEALSASLKGEIPGGAAPPIMDFTDFEPKPQPGNLEIWVDS
jgi:hypothetical protein